MPEASRKEQESNLLLNLSESSLLPRLHVEHQIHASLGKLREGIISSSREDQFALAGEFSFVLKRSDC